MGRARSVLLGTEGLSGPLCAVRQPQAALTPSPRGRRPRSELPSATLCTLLTDGGSSSGAGLQGADALLDDEVGGLRAGRLVEAPDDRWEDVESELYAVDAGIDSGAASAEEAAVQIVPARVEHWSLGWTDR